MGTPATDSIRIVGDGLVTDKACIVKAILMAPNAASDYADVYDGRDTVSGVKLFRIKAAVATTVVANLGDGIVFGRGVYVYGSGAAVETTVSFIPL
jgi:hypothetical protein